MPSDQRHVETDGVRISPWHPGERALQARRGVAERMEEVGRRVIRDSMPDQHRTFFGALRSVVLGAVDAAGRPWATWLEGPPGFLRSPDPRRLELAALPSIGDPTRPGIGAGEAVGLLGIDLATRRRNRLNGWVRDPAATGFAIEVEQSFGNCPQYIARREPQPEPAESGCDSASASIVAAPECESLSGLDARARALIAETDTAFVASFVDTDRPDGPRASSIGSGPAVSGRAKGRSVDVSHRGGRPGFLRVDGDRLTIPEFAGNLHFNTLGNLYLHPVAGLLVVDFASGDLLHLTGRATLELDSPEIERFRGAQSIWHLDVEAAVRQRGVSKLRLRWTEASPQSLATDIWVEVDAEAEAEPRRPDRRGGIRS